MVLGNRRLPLPAGAMLFVLAVSGNAQMAVGPLLASSSGPATGLEAIPDPPVVPVNHFLDSGTPRLLSPDVKSPQRPGPVTAEFLVRQADEAFQGGRRLYQTGNTDAARQQFDRAVDLLFEASETAADRPAFERRFEETVDAIHRLDVASLGSEAVDQPRFEKSPLEDILEMTFPVDPRLKNKVREELRTTSSQLPLTMNDSVLGFIHFFSGRGRRTLIAGLQRAGRYRPMIQRILAEEGIPQELIHLAQAESGFYPRAISRARATGMWQFVAFRGEEYGLKRTAHSDDRLDPEKATRAAARHLRDLYDHYGDWYLAIAAYNCGPGAVDRAIERTGYADFWELRARRVLPVETTNYVPIILAMTIMAKNAREYEIENVVPEPAIEYDVVTMTAPAHLALVADLLEAPLPELQELNPSLLQRVAPAGYSLRVPKNSGGALAATLGAISEAQRVSWRLHRVAEGETLESIGRRYGASAAALASANRLTAGALAAGERVLVPAPYPSPAARRAPAAATTRSAASRNSRARRVTHVAWSRGKRT